MATLVSFPVSDTERYSVLDDSHVPYWPYVTQPYAVVREFFLTHPSTGITFWFPMEQVDRYSDAEQAVNVARHHAGVLDVKKTTDGTH